VFFSGRSGRLCSLLSLRLRTSPLVGGLRPGRDCLPPPHPSPLAHKTTFSLSLVFWQRSRDPNCVKRPTPFSMPSVFLRRVSTNKVSERAQIRLFTFAPRFRGTLFAIPPSFLRFFFLASRRESSLFGSPLPSAAISSLLGHDSHLHSIEMVVRPLSPFQLLSSPGPFFLISAHGSFPFPVPHLGSLYSRNHRNSLFPSSFFSPSALNAPSRSLKQLVPLLGGIERPFRIFFSFPLQCHVASSTLCS